MDDPLSLPVAPPPAKMRSLADPRTPRKDLTTTFAAASPSAVGVELIVASPAELPPQLVVPGSAGGGDADSDKDAILRPTRSKLQRTSIPAAASGAGKSKPLYLKVSEAFFWLTLIGVTVLGALMMYYLIAHESEPHILAWGVGGIFVAFTIPISVHAIQLHCRYYVSSLQRQYIRIIAMPIIYAVESWLALRYTEQRIYLETLRDLYEAYVIYSFYWLLLQFLGGKKRLADRLAARGQERAKHLPPLCCLKGWRLGSRFVHRNNVGVYQYILLRVVVSIITLFCEFGGVYKEGNWGPQYFYLYATIIINISQMYALYCLALFYKELHQELKPLRPLGKFAVVKAVVFFSWWQSVAISAAVAWELVPHIMDYHTEEVAKALQNILICIEMFLAAIAHLFYYDYTDFYSPSSRQLTPLAQMQLADLEFSQAAGHKRSSSTGATFTGTAGAGGRPSRGASMSGSVAVAATGGGTDDQDDNDPYGTIKVAEPASATPAATPGGAGAAPHTRTANIGGRSRSGTAQGGMHERTASASTATAAAGLDDGVAPEPHIVTPGFKAAMYDVLPVDIITETGEHLRTGFGLVHKWEKRRAEAAATAQFQSDMDAGRLGRSKPRSKFASDSAVGGDGAADATPSSVGAADDATVAAPAASGDGAAAAGPLSGFDASGDSGFNPLAPPPAEATAAKA